MKEVELSTLFYTFLNFIYTFLNFIYTLEEEEKIIAEEVEEIMTEEEEIMTEDELMVDYNVWEDDWEDEGYIWETEEEWELSDNMVTMGLYVGGDINNWRYMPVAEFPV